MKLASRWFSRDTFQVQAMFISMENLYRRIVCWSQVKLEGQVAGKRSKEASYFWW